MAWRRPCDKPLYEAMVVSILTHIFVTPLIYRLYWSLPGLQHINSLRPSDALCVSKLTIIGSDNGLSPGRHQAIIWTNAGILLIRTLGRNSSEILGKIHSISGKKMHLNMSSAKGCVFSLCLNELIAKTGTMCRWRRPKGINKDTRTPFSNMMNFFIGLVLLGIKYDIYVTCWGRYSGCVWMPC